MPMLASIVSQRTDIDQRREQLARLQIQQRNIAVVTKEYDALKEKGAAIDEQFLRERTSVDFFNAIDDLTTASGATNSQLRIDTPVRSTRHQLLGIHLTFTASYRSTIVFLRGISQLKELVTITNVSVSNEGDSETSSVTIDAQVPWSQTL